MYHVKCLLSDGWSETTLKNMDAKMTCLDDQYSKYMIPKLKINVSKILF